MAHFAQIDEDNKVINVIVVDNIVLFDEANAAYDERLGIAHCQSLIPGKWIQTSYNNNFRKNFAGIGFTYDENRDAFIPPKPYPSWVLNEEKCLWSAPLPYPESSPEGFYYSWNEEQIGWELVAIQEPLPPEFSASEEFTVPEDFTVVWNEGASQYDFIPDNPPPAPLPEVTDVVFTEVVSNLSTSSIEQLSTATIEQLSTASVEALTTSGL